MVEEIVEETRKLAVGFFGLEPPPRTAEVFGPASYFEIFAASGPEGVVLNEEARDGWPFYLVVLRGPFAANLRFPGSPPRQIATLIWSPTEDRREFGFRNDLPAAMSRLGTAHTISLD
jgi:hypothetical protein